jgi:branched-chain amino acid transport system permease protein
MVAQDILNGLLHGGYFAIVGLGLSVAFGVLRLFNVAYGEFVIGGGYLSYVAESHLGLDPLVSLVLVVPVAAAVGYALQSGLLTSVMRRSTDAALVMTFGISLVLQSIFLKGFSANAKALNAGFASTGVGFLGLRAETVDLIAFGAAVVLVVSTHQVLTRTAAGRRVRAAAADPDTAATMGIDVRRVYAATFAFSAGLAAVAGVVIGLSSTLTPTGGAPWLVVGFAVVVLGGVGNVFGTLVAGLALGLVYAIGGQVFGEQYSDLVLYATLFIVLAARPTGLFRSAVA